MTDYIHLRKLQAAKLWFLHEHKPVGDAAHDLGYNEYTYFSRVFKKYEGISAQEYLKDIPEQ